MTSVLRRLRVCVVGLGEMGLIHARNLIKFPGVELSLACKRKEALYSVAQELRAARAFDNYEEAITDKEIEAVVLATKPRDHAKQVALAAKHGKAIFCEKPLGYSTEAVADLEETVRSCGVKCMVGFQRRFDPSYRGAWEQTRKSAMGKSLVLKCTSGDPDFPDKYQRDLGFNSTLLDLAVHDIDLARWLLRSEVSRVFASCDALVYPHLKDMGESDTALCILEMESGARCFMHLSRSLRYGYNVTSELVSADGTIQIGEVKETPMVTLKAGRASTDICPSFSQRFRIAFREEMQAFVDMLRGEPVSHFADIHDAIEATRVAETLVQSWRTGMPARVIRPAKNESKDMSKAAS
ncbi:hypothetical protein GAYE_SCF06G2750 [Galdieria yellowstonensis]|uniref:Inositol 2-dehydrogenase n=1 Tax=Galdieria yellowstonensis TaxID=3028027 RepID=A0AAV9I7C4_9RHOD|nr:hypothetical protein GAYE_HTGSCF06PCTG21G0334 [Galdieria yellowstonensis]KAK4524848.1 hypothetical protein GAYE_SCF06G2750 [Galdieria yellowstonensis]